MPSTELNYADLVNQINIYFTLVVVPIGFLTNIVSIVIFIRPNLMRTTSGFFNLLISISNLLSLAFYFFFHRSTITLKFDFATQTDIGCKLFMFSRRLIREITPILEVIMTLERFLSIYFPKRFVFFQNKSFILKFFAITVVFFAFLNFENLFYSLDITTKSSVQTVNDTQVWINTTSKSCGGLLFVTVGSDFTSAALRLAVPFIIMLILNALMVKKLLVKRGPLHISTQRVRKERNFTIIVLSMNTMFLVMNCPEVIGYGLVNGLTILQKPSNNTLQIVNLYWAIAYVFSTSHYIVTILSHFVFNRQFRVELFALLRLKRIAHSSVGLTLEISVRLRVYKSVMMKQRNINYEFN